jgi:SNF2 family DNA or RNA helicase
MAKLFGKEYHELSNSWFFHSLVIAFEESELSYQVSRNEKDELVFRFYPTLGFSKSFPSEVIVIYDSENEIIIESKCSSCNTIDGNCVHYLSIVNYAYKFLSTERLGETNLCIFQNKMLAYNRYWQTVFVNGKILIEGLYDVEQKNVRVYFKDYNSIDFRSLLTKLVGISGNNTPAEVKSKKMALSQNSGNELKKAEEVSSIFAAFPDTELFLLEYLNQKRTSFSEKKSCFTITKKNFIILIPFLKDIHHKVYLRETGEKLNFSDDLFQLTLSVTKDEEGGYLIQPVLPEHPYSFLLGNSTYLLMGNILYKLRLPLHREIIKKIFTGGFHCQESDLVYLRTIVAKQLNLNGCYLDFTDDIAKPEAYVNNPEVIFAIRKVDGLISIEGKLRYNDETSVPMNVVSYDEELVALKNRAGVYRWFYLPYELRKDLIAFLGVLPRGDEDHWNNKSLLIYHSQDKIDRLKKAIFEISRQDWTIDLEDALRKEFVQLVDLKPVVSVDKSASIDWFDYKIEYKYGNLTFTHEELRKFFRSKNKYLKLPDNTMVSFTGKEKFDEIESYLKYSDRKSFAQNQVSLYNIFGLHQLAQKNKMIKIAGDSYLRKMYEDLLNRNINNTDVLPPQELQYIMRSYQKTGFRWLKLLQNYRLGGILADDMGLGKTLQALAILSDFHAMTKKNPPNDEHDSEAAVKKSLVVCPKTLLFNWAMEIEKFHPNLTFLIYEGMKNERVKLLEVDEVDVIIVSYSLIQQDVSLFSQEKYAYIILDEAQHIKNPRILRSKAVKKLHSEHRLALTGTPLENNSVELWSIYDFLMPGYLKPLRYFKREYNNETETVNLKAEELSKVISPFILRRKKSEVLLELPDKQEQIVFCKMTSQQEKLYLKVLAWVRTTILSHDVSEIEKDYINVLTALTRLRQVSNHPALIENSYRDKSEVSGKMELLNELIQDAVENNRKILVFSQFAQMLKVISSSLQLKGISYEYLDGTTKNRRERIENFTNNEKIRVFLLTLKVGGIGLNLTAADTVIIVEPWWNPMAENQSIDRVYRIGQTKKVMVYKLITKGTVEEKIMQLQDRKSNLFNKVVEGSQDVIAKLSISDIMKLFEYHEE